MSAETWIKWGDGFVGVAESAAARSNPSGYVAVYNAWQGAENSLKAILVKAGVNWDHGLKGHDLSYLIGLIDSNSLANKAEVAQLKASARVITNSGSYMEFKYPDKDPIFFENLQPADITNRVGESRNLNNLCSSLVSGVTTSTSSA